MLLIRTTNPLKYSSVNGLIKVHSTFCRSTSVDRRDRDPLRRDWQGVWANMLHNVYAALVGAHGWSATAKTNPDGTEGNIVYLHLFLDALRLQPCNPTRSLIFSAFHEY